MFTILTIRTIAVSVQRHGCNNNRQLTEHARLIK